MGRSNIKNVVQSTMIAEGVIVFGGLQSDGVVHISGNVDGPVKVAELDIGSEGHITGDVSAKRVIVSGEIRGCILGDSIHLKSTAKVFGDITYDALTSDAGARIEGRLIKATSSSPVAAS